MNLLEYLDRAGERRVKSQRPGEGSRLLISIIIMIMFAFMMAKNPTAQLIIGALISMGSGVVGYWLGSSKGSADKSVQLARDPSGNPSDPVSVIPGEKPAA